MSGRENNIDLAYLRRILHHHQRRTLRHHPGSHHLYVEVHVRVCACVLSA